MKSYTTPMPSSSALKVAGTEMSPAPYCSSSQCLLSVFSPSHSPPISCLAERKIPKCMGVKAPHKLGSWLNIWRHQEQVEVTARDKGRCAPSLGSPPALTPGTTAGQAQEAGEALQGWITLGDEVSEEKAWEKQLQHFPHHPSSPCLKTHCLGCRRQSYERQKIRKESSLLAKLGENICWCWVLREAPADMVLSLSPGDVQAVGRCEHSALTVPGLSSLQCTELVEGRASGGTQL